MRTKAESHNQSDISHPTLQEALDGWIAAAVAGLPSLELKQTDLIARDDLNSPNRTASLNITTAGEMASAADYNFGIALEKHFCGPAMSPLIIVSG